MQAQPLDHGLALSMFSVEFTDSRTSVPFPVTLLPPPGRTCSSRLPHPNTPGFLPNPSSDIPSWKLVELFFLFLFSKLKLITDFVLP